MRKKKSVVEPLAAVVEAVKPVDLPEPPKPTYDDLVLMMSGIQIQLEAATKGMVSVVNFPEKATAGALEGIAKDAIALTAKIEALVKK